MKQYDPVQCNWELTPEKAKLRDEFMEEYRRAFEAMDCIKRHGVARGDTEIAARVEKVQALLQTEVADYLNEMLEL